MSIYTLLSDHDVKRVLSTYSVGELVSFKGIEAGIHNSNYYIDTTQDRYILTVFEELAEAPLMFCLHLMQHFSSKGIPCASPIEDADGNILQRFGNKPMVLFQCLQGETLNVPNGQQAFAAGAALGQLHVLGQALTQTRINPRGATWWSSTAKTLLPLVEKDVATLLNSQLHLLKTIPWQKLPQGIVHGDFFKDNLLFIENTLTGVLDFYEACTDALAYDLAIAICSWCFDKDQNFLQDVYANLLQGYQSKRPLTPQEKSTWPNLLHAGVMPWWINRIWLIHHPKQGEQVTIKDPSDMARILTFYHQNPQHFQL